MWPFNCRAAVSLTYDDGWDSNLDSAMPDLEDRGMRGTFFITPGFWAAKRDEEWKAACRRGHEIANHTWDHPCDRLGTFSSADFSSQQTGRTEQWLNDHIGLNGVAGTPDDLRTYAYICGEEKLGPGDDNEARARYLDLVRRTFWAARSGGGGPTTIAEVLAKPHNIPAQALTFDYGESDKTIAYCDRAATENGWAVLIFHNIVAGAPQQETDTSRPVHIEVLDYLAKHQDKFWIAPFREVYRQIRSLPTV